MRRVFIALTGLALCLSGLNSCKDKTDDKVLVGAYYFDGWAGQCASRADWAVGMPTHMTERMLTEFPEREPLWGWRDDDLALMEKQIDLAADNGIDFFAFCWYWRNDQKDFDQQAVDNLELHTGLRLFMQARNKDRMKFCLLIANHPGARITGQDNWNRALEYYSENYFNDPQYLKIDNKPVINIFRPLEAVDYVEGMQAKAKELGYPGVYTMACNHHNEKFDLLTWYNIREEEPKVSTERAFADYLKFVEREWVSADTTDCDYAPNVMVGWDQRPWDKKDTTLFYTQKSPELFSEHLQHAYDYINERNPKHKVIIIYAWNEYGEGGWLPPTKGDPEGVYLKAIKDIKDKNSK